MGVFDSLGDLKKPEKATSNEAVPSSNDQNDVNPRHELTQQDVVHAWQLAKSQMNETLSKDVEAYLSDILLENEKRIYSIRSSPKGRRSQLVLTDRALYIFSYGIFSGEGQDVNSGIPILDLLMTRARMSIRIYPIKQIQLFEIQPPKGITTGHFQVFTGSTLGNDEETKFILDTNVGYFKVVIVYKTISEMLQAATHAA